MPPAPEPAPPYRHVAWAYDAIASAYSLGAIDRAKAFHQRMIKAGDRVLYAGAGRGREIVAACERGAEVTCIEPCPAMASTLRQRTGRFKNHITIDTRPIQSVPPDPAYDCVVAHFFLNVFDTHAMPEVLARLAAFVKPGGSLIIADFKPNAPHTNSITRLTRAAYYHPLNLAGRLLRICTLHPVYDYAPLLEKQDFSITSRTAFRCLPATPALYETLVATRKKQPPPCGEGC